MSGNEGSSPEKKRQSALIDSSFHQTLGQTSGHIAFSPTSKRK